MRLMPNRNSSLPTLCLLNAILGTLLAGNLQQNFKNKNYTTK
jgi:hypothetical protein